jgi:hypothetical protein
MANRFQVRGLEFASFIMAVAVGPVSAVYLQFPEITGALEYTFVCLFVLPLITALASRSPFVVWQISVLSLTASITLQIYFRNSVPRNLIDLLMHVLVTWVFTTVLSAWFPAYLWLFDRKPDQKVEELD